MLRIWVTAGAASAFLSVAIGAFGAHALQLTDHYADTFDTGVQYHMLHAAAMLVVGIVSKLVDSPRLLTWAGRAFAVGTILFSGSLYVLSITEISKLGAITPFGGFAFLFGWVLLGSAVWHKSKPSS